MKLWLPTVAIAAWLPLAEGWTRYPLLVVFGMLLTGLLWGIKPQ